MLRFLRRNGKNGHNGYSSSVPSGKTVGRNGHIHQSDPGHARHNGHGHTGSNGHNGNGHAGSNGFAKQEGLTQVASPVTEPMIDLRGITKAYQTDAGPFWALKGIDLQVRPGEFVAVVGKSGSGKSTLINMFTGIDHPTEGEAVVARTRIRELDESQMAAWRGRNLGIVFQFFQLLPTLTLLENIMLPMDLCQVYESGERAERAMQLLAQFDLAQGKVTTLTQEGNVAIVVRMNPIRQGFVAQLRGHFFSLVVKQIANTLTTVFGHDV